MGTAYDAHHESVGLVALLAVVALFILGASLFTSPSAALLSLRRCERSLSSAALEFAVAAAGAMSIIVGMEGYETHFGGISPFDPHAILMHDGPATSVLYILVFVVVRAMVCAYIRAAVSARIFLTACSLVRRNLGGAARLLRYQYAPIRANSSTARSHEGELRAPPLAAVFSF